jgi:hypothetical protein
VFVGASIPAAFYAMLSKIIIAPEPARVEVQEET